MSINITGTTKLTGLLGSPVSHSISPMMHNEAFSLLGLDYIYLCFDVDTTSLKTAVDGMRAMGVKGFNLTMPNKNLMVELADKLSPAAEMIGAVNTVVNGYFHICLIKFRCKDTIKIRLNEENTKKFAFSPVSTGAERSCGQDHEERICIW